MCPIRTNPADYFIKILSLKSPLTENNKRKVEFLKKSYEEHAAQIEMEKQNNSMCLVEFD